MKIIFFLVGCLALAHSISIDVLQGSTHLGMGPRFSIVKETVGEEGVCAFVNDNFNIKGIDCEVIKSE